MNSPLLTGVLGAIAGFWINAHAAGRPNIVFIMTDDQAAWAVGAHGHGTHANTPHLDRLFQQGAYLTNCFTTTPVCSPSRATIATSRYGSEIGITDWIHPAKEPDLGLAPDIVTWYEALQAAGYHTGLVGKWHLGKTDAHYPTKTGFNYFMGHREGGWSTDNPTLEKDGQPVKFEGLTTDILTDYAIEFLSDRPPDKPFLLVLHYRAPHTRWLPVALEDWAPFENLEIIPPHPDYPGLDTPRVKQMTREYLASVRGVDRSVGRLMKTLEDMRLSENTAVIFTSDHGYNMGHNGIWHKGNGLWVLTKDALPTATANIPRGQRPNMYDASLRVPAAIRWPGMIEAGTRVSHTITFLDWYPTICAIAGIELPKHQVIRGRNALPLIRGQKVAWDDDLYSEYSTHHQSRTHMRSYRTPQWKLVRDFLNSGRDELFDLTNDPDETTNVIGVPQNAGIVAALHSKILAKMRENGDPILESATHP